MKVKIVKIGNKLHVLTDGGKTLIPGPFDSKRSASLAISGHLEVMLNDRRKIKTILSLAKEGIEKYAKRFFNNKTAISNVQHAPKVGKHSVKKGS